MDFCSLLPLLAHKIFSSSSFVALMILSSLITTRFKWVNIVKPKKGHLVVGGMCLSCLGSSLGGWKTIPNSFRWKHTLSKTKLLRGRSKCLSSPAEGMTVNLKSSTKSLHATFTGSICLNKWGKGYWTRSSCTQSSAILRISLVFSSFTPGTKAKPIGVVTKHPRTPDYGSWMPHTLLSLGGNSQL